MSGPDRLDPPKWWGDVENLLQVTHTLAFVQNRLDGVAEDVISWMPPTDNELHHNAVEHLRRAWEETERVRRHLLVLSGADRIRKATPDPYTYGVDR